MRRFASACATVLMLAGCGRGTTPPFTVGNDAPAMAVGDLDGDGQLDLVTCLDDTGPVGVRLWGTLPGSDDPAILDSGVVVRFTLADSTNDAVRITPSFGRLLAHELTHVVQQSGGGVRARVGSAAITDLDGDGLADLVLVRIDDMDATLESWLQTPDGTFVDGPTLDLEADQCSELVCEDNGRNDLPATKEKGDVYLESRHAGHPPALVALHVVAGKWTEVESPVPGAGMEPGPIALADLDGDGILDAAIARPDEGTVCVLRGQGGGAFAPWPTAPDPIDVGGRPAGVAFGRLNDGAIVDLAVQLSNWETLPGGGADATVVPRLVVLDGLGDGRFKAPRRVSPDATLLPGFAPGPDTVQSTHFVTGDVDGDGVDDLVVPGSSGRLVFFFSEPVGFAAAPSRTTDGRIAIAPFGTLVRIALPVGLGGPLKVTFYSGSVR